MGIVAIMNEEKKSMFPENKIILINGRTIDCYPVAEKEKAEVIDDRLKLDTTGRYLAIGRKRFNPIPPTPKEVEEQRNLFINNAFYLLAHKEQIMADSRMFLCPVSIKNGLAYTGTSGFTNPTLGIYIEWWMNCPGAMQTDKNGNRLLIYHLAGSPLSGANHCMAVCENGQRQKVTLLPFIKHWKPFIEINGRYTEAKTKYQSYSLQQVLDILEKEDENAQAIETDFLKHEMLRITKEMEQLKTERDKWFKKYNELLAKNNNMK